MKQATRQRDIDLIHGSLWDKLLLLALPLAATAMLQQLFNAADVAVVGNFVPDEALAKAAMGAVGGNSAVVNLLVNCCVGISLGANVLISQCIGMGDHDSIRRAIHTSIVVSVLGGLVMGLAGQLFVRPLLRRMCSIWRRCICGSIWRACR